MKKDGALPDGNIERTANNAQNILNKFTNNDDNANVIQYIETLSAKKMGSVKTGKRANILRTTHEAKTI